MISVTCAGLLVPFFGTALGAVIALAVRERLQTKSKQLLSGFAAGVMIAASVWSLLLPSIELSEKVPWLIPSAGFAAGVVFLIVCERFFKNNPTLFAQKDKSFRENGMLIFAVTVHNIPEGMAVGVAFAIALQKGSSQALAGAVALAVGIAIQNIPEGAIISLPLISEGVSGKKAVLAGILSGAVEPIGALLTLLLTSLVSKLLPLLLAFAAGAMVFVCVNDLIPQAHNSEKPVPGVFGFALGFLIMMILDVALG